jgi:hypothetical protein
MNIESLNTQDIVNLALQRTSSLVLVPVFGKRKVSPSYYLWTKFGNDFLLRAEAKYRRHAIMSISEQEIRTEISRLVKPLSGQKINSLASIGPGLGIEVVELAKALPISEVLLIDIEENNRFHHGFEAEGAGYNDLAVTKNFIEVNLDRNLEYRQINPLGNDILQQHRNKYDLIVSLISCGFHYPAETYLQFFKDNIAGDGCIILDLRVGEDHSVFLDVFDTELIEMTEKYQRVLCRKKR